MVLLFSFLFSNNIFAATVIPPLLHHQGRLLDSSGNLLGGSSGTNYCFKFSFYDNPAVGSGTKLWPSGSPSKMTVNVKKGILNVDIGDTSVGGDPLDFDFTSNDEVYLNIDIASSISGSCASVTSFETLSPRQRIVSTAYALNSKTVSGFTPSQTPTGSQIPVLNSGALNLAGTISSGGLALTLGSDATGDIFYRNSSGNFSRLGIGNEGQALVVSAGGLPSWGTVSGGSGGGDALVANPLSQFAATTSLQLKGVISDETGSGALVFSDSPVFTTPNIGNATGSITGNAATATNLTGLTATVSNLNTITGALGTAAFTASTAYLASGGTAAAVTGATFTKNLTVNGGNTTITGNADNTSVLTVGSGAVSVSGSNTGDNATNTQYSGLATSKQDTLVSGTSIKTVNSTSLLGSGDVAVQPTLVSGTNIKTINSTSLLGSGDIAVLTSGGALGTPSSGTMTNVSGTAANLTAGHVTNATLTTAFTNQGGAGVLAWPAAGATLTIPTGGGTLGTAAFSATGDFATAAQGTLATNALPSSSFTDTAVTGKLITGYVSGAGTVAATDTILQAINKLNGNIALKGTGTVTSVDTTAANNGVTATWATTTTTPRLTIGLGAITPTSVNSVVISGSATPTLAVTGTTTVSGSNTGDQDLSTLATKTGSNWTFASQAIGDLVYASSTTAFTRLADVATGSVLISGGAGAAPSWSTTPTFTGTNISGTAANLTAGHVTNATFTTALTVDTGALTIHAASGTSVLTIGAGAVSVSGSNTGDQTSVTGNAGTATALASSRNIWGQSFNGSADVTGSLTGVGDITGGASNMAITAGTGNSRTLTLKSTTSGGTATAFLTGNADQSSTFGGNISGTGAWTLTGGAGNMTIVSGTGNSRTMVLQTTTARWNCGNRSYFKCRPKR